MKKNIDDLSLLDQHIFKQNQHIIEMSARLSEFLSKTNSAVDFAEEKASERNNATKWAVIGLIASAVIFGGTGYLVRWGADSLNLSEARELVQAAKNEAESEKESFKKYQAEVDKKFETEVEKIRAAAGWAASPDGRLAKRFFDVGGKKAATCGDEQNWRVEERTTEDKKVVKVCITKMRNIIADDKISGWIIP